MSETTRNCKTCKGKGTITKRYLDGLTIKKREVDCNNPNCMGGVVIINK